MLEKGISLCNKNDALHHCPSMGVVSVFISVVVIVEFHCEWGETQKLFLQITYIKGCQK